jgi:membrane dipeptidase
MQRLAARGGVLGIQAHPAALGPGAGLASVVDHLDHAVQVVGIDHVGMGADFVKRFADLGLIASPSAALLPSGGAMLEAVEGFAGPEDFPALCAVLAARGYSSDHVHAILWSNFARILRATLPRVG